MTKHQYVGDPGLTRLAGMDPRTGVRHASHTVLHDTPARPRVGVELGWTRDGHPHAEPIDLKFDNRMIRSKKETGDRVSRWMIGPREIQYGGKT